MVYQCALKLCVHIPSTKVRFEARLKLKSSIIWLRLSIFLVTNSSGLISTVFVWVFTIMVLVSVLV